MPRLLSTIRSCSGRASLSGRFLNGACWTVAGTLTARLCTLLTMAVVARWIGRDEFGRLGVLHGTVMMMVAAAGLGTGVTATRFIARLREKDPEQAGSVLSLTLWVAFASGGLLALLVAATSPWLADRVLADASLTPFLVACGFWLWLTTVQGAQNGALAGCEAFRALSLTAAAAALAGIPLILLATRQWNLSGALAGGIAATAVHVLLAQAVLSRQARRCGIPLRFRVQRGSWSVLWSFSLPAALSGVMVAPVQWACAALLAHRPGGYAELGSFYAANQWFLAALFLPTVLGRVLLPLLSQLSASADPKRVARTIVRAALLNAAVVAPLVLAGCLASPWIMRLYGPGFADDASVLVWTLLTAGLLAVQLPVGQALIALGRVWSGFVMNIGWAVSCLAATAWLLPLGADGLALGRLAAYVAHATWTAAFVFSLLRTTQRVPDGTSTATAPV